MSDLERLRNEEAELELKLAKLREQRIVEEQKARPEVLKSRVPLRIIVLSQLLDAGTALNSLLLSRLIQARLSKKVPSTRFGTLSTDEEKSYLSRRPRPVYLCHCLSYDTGEPIKRYWARSDWPLVDRVSGPISGRVHFLKSAYWTISLAKHADEAAEPDLLRFVAADQARDAGLSVTRGEFPIGEWLSSIADKLSKFEQEDLLQRQAAAETLETALEGPQLLYGARPGLVSLPGSSDGWRSAAS